jgi:LacI family transcriptional regulator
MITIKEVSEFAKVSQSTVSRVLNDHPTVKPSNREKVYAAIEALGYKPNAFAQALASSRSNSIGLVVGSLEGWFFGSYMQVIEEHMRNNGYHVITTNGHTKQDTELESIQFLNSKRVDGLIVHSDMMSDEELIKASENGVPMIIINRFVPELADNCFFIDNLLGGQIATQHLIESGHKHIGIITGELGKVDCQHRLGGYRKALEHNGIQYNPDLVKEGRFELDMNLELVKEFFDEQPQMTAVFCENDNIAMAVYDECRRRNLVIGEDISVVGYDNSIYCRYIRPSLTTIDYPVKEMATSAVNKLLNLLGQKSRPVELDFEPKLIKRESVKNLKLDYEL